MVGNPRLILNDYCSAGYLPKYSGLNWNKDTILLILILIRMASEVYDLSSLRRFD
jgi:hypothetical protein